MAQAAGVSCNLTLIFDAFGRERDAVRSRRRRSYEDLLNPLHHGFAEVARFLTRLTILRNYLDSRRVVPFG